MQGGQFLDSEDHFPQQHVQSCFQIEYPQSISCAVIIAFASGLSKIAFFTSLTDIPKGIPILLVKDSELNNGVFDENLTECYVANISSDYDIKKLEQNPQFEEWLSKL